MITIAVGEADFDVAARLAELEAMGGGAVASFTGIVRGDGGLIALELEHYPAMTHEALTRLAEDAARRWPLLGIVLIHRVGRMAPGERIVFVGTASSHRAAALDACHFLIDWLKTEAPFWKKEHRADGSTWVEARTADDAARDRWIRD
ncbi:molybdenum cofactor biosynthesis protein MoaE [Sphingomonas colocasiae]|uniref:Molybdopterin synthase catalytic subunit n=1 Tax=Sphingomonas colocasiae TaxID=1848973 RepID=A0ABS7PHV2_9SPHN|nr:molybdenum cofactor biosynthesis protein MoaE [Sphingomonas colocasiae]MBY8820876.1 molybdenum cofactor biosynthesis protein MoaE [Sphingomonas colocasiae]